MKVYKTHVVDVLTCEGAIESFTVKSDEKGLGKAILETLSSLYQWDDTPPVVRNVQVFDAEYLM